MLTIKLLMDNSTVNNYRYLEAKDYTPGVAFDVKFQLYDSETHNRYMPASGSTMSVVMKDQTGTDFTKVASMLFSADDRSMWTFSLTALEATNLTGGNFKVELNEGGTISVGMAYISLSKVTFEGDC